MYNNIYQYNHRTNIEINYVLVMYIYINDNMITVYHIILIQINNI